MKQIIMTALIGSILLGAGCKKDKDTDPAPKVPVLVKIERLEISGWPASAPNGSGWDPFDAPDIYIQVYNGNTLKLETNHVLNVSPTQTLTLDEQITFAPEDLVIVVLMDHDEIDPDDKIGQTGWIAWVEQNGEQTVFTETLGDFTVKRIQSYVY